MTVRDIQAVARAYARAAIRAQTAGFDGLQILAAHGFLLSQFLCPRYNDRPDAYGGSIENGARLLLEVLASIRAAVGRSYPVLVKLNSRDFVENGLRLEDSIQVGIMLTEGGIDAIESTHAKCHARRTRGSDSRLREGRRAYHQLECGACASVSQR